LLSTTHIPQSPGIYIFKDSDSAILYIGKAKNLLKRVQQYFSPGSLWKQDMLNHATTVEHIVVQSDNEAYLLESNLIKQHQPPYNSLLKWDNSYVFVKITNEDFGQIILTRKRSNDGATYIWPKQNTRELKNLLQYLRTIYKFRTSKKSVFRLGKLDSDFHFGLDMGWSTLSKLKAASWKPQEKEIIRYAKSQWLIIDKSYQEYVKLYKYIVKDIVAFFQWNTKPVVKRIHTEIQEAISGQRFERAAKLRDILQHIDLLTQRQTVFVNPGLTGFAAKVSKLNNWWIFTIITIHEGKIIDVIRGKKNESQIWREGIQSWIQASYGNFFVYNGDTHREKISDQDSTLRLMDTALQKIKKSERMDLFAFLDNALESYVASTSLQEENLLSESLAQLQGKYSLVHFPYRMECVDISHLSGGWMSGGLSCLVWWIKYPRWYRRYKIKSIKTLDQQNNDYLALEEVLTRRFTNNNNLPDLMIVDGGKWQLAVVQKLIAKWIITQDILNAVQFVALGKGDARKRSGKNKGEKEMLYVLQPVTFGRDVMITRSIKDKEISNFYDSSLSSSKWQQEYSAQLFLLSYDHADQLLTTIRDEAHRFANAYRKKQMSKEWK